MPDHIENTSHNSSHDNGQVNPEQSAVLTKFLDKLADEEKDKFLRTLSEEERISFTSSLEEFRQVFDREPQQRFPNEKPDFERDVKFSGVMEKRIAERFAEVMKMFPDKVSLESLRSRAFDADNPRSDSIFRSTDDLREVGDAPKITLKIAIS